MKIRKMLIILSVIFQGRKHYCSAKLISSPLFYFTSHIYMTIHRNVNLILWTNKVKHIWISCSETFLQISLHYCQKKSCSMRYEESHNFLYINVYELLPKRFLRISSLYLYWPDISALLQCKDCSYNFCNSAVQHLTL